MLKTRFRGERKRKGTRPQAIGTRGEYDEKGEIRDKNILLKEGV